MPSSATLILCTRNGGRQLKPCLDHIDALDAPDAFEIILVDNGSDNPTSINILNDFSRTTRHQCRLVREPRRGNGAGRNAGIVLAQHEILIFIDDDCYVDRNLVKDWIDVFSSNTIGYATGRVLPHNLDHAIQGFCRTGLNEERIAPHAFVRTGFMQGSNMAFSRACMDAVRGFDPLFGSGVRYAGEDWDIALRASAAGFAGGYFPTPTVSHDHGRSLKEGDERLHFYLFGLGAVYAKHLRGKRGADMGRRFLRQALRPKSPNRWRLMAGFFDYLANHHPDQAEYIMSAGCRSKA